MFLITTADQRFWKTDEPILFLGEWCKLYSQKSVWEKLSYETLPHPWDDREEKHKAALYEEDVYEELLEVLAEFLSNVHEERHGKKYWRIILGPWLLFYVQVIHERYVCLKRAFDLYPDLDTIGLASSSFKIPRHFWDHAIGSSSDIYNLQLYTSVLKSMGYNIPVCNLKWTWSQEPENILSSKSHDKRKIFRRRIKGKLNTLFNTIGPYWARQSHILMVDMYLPLKLIAQIMLKTGFKARWCKLPDSEKWVDMTSNDNLHPNRQDLSKLLPRKKDLFQSLLIRTLPDNFPLMYLEGYRYCRNWVKNIWNVSTTKMILTANAIEGNESFKFLAADLTEKGAKLIAIQHGGSYGSARYNPLEYLECSVADEFWSWGWGEQLFSVRPMPNPKLSYLASKRKYVKRDNEQFILYIGSNLSRFHCVTWSNPIANQGVDYIKWQIRFLEELDLRVRSKLIFRCFPIDWGWALQQRLQDSCPDVHLGNPQNNYYSELLSASLVVCDMNQTTLLEGLAANIPIIAFFNPCHVELRLQAEHYFDKLRNVGILHNSPAKAAKKVNEIAEDPKAWWEQSDVQTAKDRFCFQFARTSTNWLEEWRGELIRQIKN